MLVLVENAGLNSALVLGGVYPRNLRSVVVMSVVYQGHKNDTLTNVNYSDQIIQVVYSTWKTSKSFHCVGLSLFLW